MRLVLLALAVITVAFAAGERLARFIKRRFQ